MTDCRNTVEHSETGKGPYDKMFRRPALYLEQIHPFGCKALCKPPVKKLSTGGPRLCGGACLDHDGGGLSWLYFDARTVHTNQIWFKESEFLGLAGIEQETLHSNGDKTVSLTEFELKLSDAKSVYSTVSGQLQDDTAHGDAKEHGEDVQGTLESTSGQNQNELDPRSEL